VGDDEYAALLRLPHKARLIYLMELRRYMNYSTGIVGRPPRLISLCGLRELLEVSKRYTANNKADRCTVKQVRTALNQLERVGLIKRLSGTRKNDKETLVFKLKLAHWDQSVSNSEGRGQGRGQGRRPIVHIVNNGAGYRDDQRGGQGRGQGASEGTHPYIQNNKKKAQKSVDKSEFVDNFSNSHQETVPNDFSPNDNTREACREAMCPTIDGEAIESFKAHYKIAKTRSHDWQSYFVKWMIKRKMIKKRSKW